MGFHYILTPLVYQQEACGDRVFFKNNTSCGLAHEMIVCLCNVCVTGKSKTLTTYEDNFQDGDLLTATNMMSQVTCSLTMFRLNPTCCYVRESDFFAFYMVAMEAILDALSFELSYMPLPSGF